MVMQRRYSVSGMAADVPAVPSTPKRMPKSLMDMKRDSNSRKYNIGALATPGRKKLPVVPTSSKSNTADAPSFCTPTRQMSFARLEPSSSNLIMPCNLDDDSEASLDEERQTPRLGAGRASLAGRPQRRLSLSLARATPKSNKQTLKRASTCESNVPNRRISLSQSNHQPRPHRQSLSQSNHNPRQSIRGGGLDGGSLHGASNNLEPRRGSARRRSSLGGGPGPMRRAAHANLDSGSAHGSRRTSTRSSSRSRSSHSSKSCDDGDDISIDDTVQKVDHKIAAVTPRGSVRKRNTLLGSTPYTRADEDDLSIDDTAVIPRRSVKKRDGLSSSTHSKRADGDDLSIDDTVQDKVKATTPRGSIKKRDALSSSTHSKRGEIPQTPTKEGSKQLRRQSSVDKSPSKSPDKKGRTKKKVPSKKSKDKPSFLAPIRRKIIEVADDSMDISAITHSFDDMDIDDENSFAEEDEDDGKIPDMKKPTGRLPKRSKSTGSANIKIDNNMDLDNISEEEEDEENLSDKKKPSRLPKRSKSTGSANIKSKTHVSAKLDVLNPKKQGNSTSQSILAEEKEEMGTVEMVAEVHLPSRSSSPSNSSCQEVIAVAVTPVICDEGLVTNSISTSFECKQREASTTWHCTCGHESEKRQRFCGMCGTKQHWICTECQSPDNLCIYSFCTLCGTPKENPGGASSHGKSHPLAPCSPASVLNMDDTNN